MITITGAAKQGITKTQEVIGMHTFPNENEKGEKRKGKVVLYLPVLHSSQPPTKANNKTVDEAAKE